MQSNAGIVHVFSIHIEVEISAAWQRWTFLQGWRVFVFGCKWLACHSSGGDRNVNTPTARKLYCAFRGDDLRQAVCYIREHEIEAVPSQRRLNILSAQNMIDGRTVTLLCSTLQQSLCLSFG